MHRTARRVAVGAVALALSACSSSPLGGELEVDTARIELGDRRLVVDLEGCGRDGEIVFLAGSRGGVYLQAVLDLEDAVEGSGVTIDLSTDDAVGAFGANAAPALGVAGTVGAIERVARDDDRVLLEAEVVTLEQRDDGFTPTHESRGTLVLAARCPERPEAAATRR